MSHGSCSQLRDCLSGGGNELFKARGNTDDAEGKRPIDISFGADVNLFDTQMASPTGVQSPEARID